jgi:hypothetical protein
MPLYTPCQSSNLFLSLVKRKLTRSTKIPLLYLLAKLAVLFIIKITIMKKLVLSALALVGIVSFSIAQTAAKTAAPAAKPKMETAKKTAAPATSAKLVSAPVAKTAAVPAAKPATAATATPLKKDGTPDKRYKANQTVPAGPLKKDGTPDKRYKANKKS